MPEEQTPKCGSEDPIEKRPTLLLTGRWGSISIEQAPRAVNNIAIDPQIYIRAHQSSVAPASCRRFSVRGPQVRYTLLCIRRTPESQSRAPRPPPRGPPLMSSAVV